MTLCNLITFCQKNRVEVSLGFDPITENIVVKMRRGNFFQVDYNVPHPNAFHSSEDWEHMVVMMLSGMARQLEMQESQRKEGSNGAC